MLEERGYRPVNIAGSSAGAIVAALVAAGYSADKLYDVMANLDFNKFKDKSWEDFIPIIPRVASMVLDHSIYEGDRFLAWIKDLLQEVKGPGSGELTFADLVRDPNIEDVTYRYSLQVIVSDVADRRMLVLPRDACDLGWVHPDRLLVALVIRMSIPVFFEPVTLMDNSGRKHVLVDGGMLSNYPIWLFDAPEGQQPARPTFGLKLVEKDPRAPLLKEGAGQGGEPEKRRKGLLQTLRETGTLGYLWSLVETMMEAHDRLYVEQRKFDTTIAIDTRGVGTTEFDLTKDRLVELYDSGHAAAEEYLEKFGSK